MLFKLPVHYTIVIDKKITALSHSIEDYSQKLISINQKISDNEKSLSLINKEFNSKFMDVKFDELLKENQRDNIRKTALQNFTWDTQANKLLQIVLG